jgi:hypothetical protein
LYLDIKNEDRMMEKALKLTTEINQMKMKDFTLSKETTLTDLGAILT